MGHQALHFSKAIQRSVGWPFCVERREERGVDEKAPSISPMRGSARLPLGILGWPFYLERREERGVDEKAPSISPMKGECSATTWDSWVDSVWSGLFLLDWAERRSNKILLSIFLRVQKKSAQAGELGAMGESRLQMVQLT